MKVVFLGCTKFSESLLETVIDIKGVYIQAIFSIPEEFNISYSKERVKNTNYVNLKPYADKIDVPFYEVDGVEGKKLKDYNVILERLSPDIMLVMGWYFMVSKSTRNIARLGAWGIHASLLPKYAGGAPLVWAIIEGEKETGVSLFRMSGGVDDGDLISQKSFPIESTDTIKEVYEKATDTSIEILEETLKSPQTIKFTRQDKEMIEVYPQRSPEDGEIDWTWEPERIYNFIRAQTKPYPGAWTILGDKKVTIWSANIERYDKERI